ncbi:MAG: hypothetical protein WBE48_06945 [Xanthobacteraceae bacterium]|jgi:hypothetical protein
MSEKPAAKLKLTDAERHKRFLEMAREVEASPDMKDFEKAFKKIVPPKRKAAAKAR